MSRLPSVSKLYERFDAIFLRPSEFHNLGCCVSVKAERPLLEIPREKLTQRQLSRPVGHYRSCFGTFEQIAYFVPRIIELLARSRERLNEFGFWSMLRADREKYVELNLWDHLVDAINEIFVAKIGTFRVKHTDEEGCRRMGSMRDYLDQVDGNYLIDDLLTEFFYPELSREPADWETFFSNWTRDANPHHIAHLLDVLKRRWTGSGPKIFNPEWMPMDEFFEVTAKWNQDGARHEDIVELSQWWAEKNLSPDMPFPKAFELELQDDEFIEELIRRATPVLSSLESPTWMSDFQTAMLGRKLKSMPALNTPDSEYIN